MYQVFELGLQYYIIDLETLNIEEVSGIELESRLEEDESSYINAEMLNDYLHVYEMTLTHPDHDIEILLNDPKIYIYNDELQIFDTHYKIVCEDGSFTFKVTDIESDDEFEYDEFHEYEGDFTIDTSGHLVEEFFIIYAFIYDDFLFLRCKLLCDYDEPYFCTILYDLHEKNFTWVENSSSVNKENIFSKIKPGVRFCVKLMCNQEEFNRLYRVNIDDYGYEFE